MPEATDAETCPLVPEPKFRLGLRAAVVLFCCCFGVVLAGPLAWYNYSRNSQAALQMAESLFEHAGGTVLLETRLLVHPLNFLTDHMQDIPGAKTAEVGFDHPLLPMLTNLLEENSQLYSVYFGYGDGGFLRAIALAGRPEVARQLKAPPDAAMALRLIVPGGADRMESWRFIGADRKILPGPPPHPAKYDPRGRPWYVSASQMDGPVRTSLYRFSSTGQLGLTVSRRISGSTPLVFGVDMTLDSLAGFLREERLGKGGLLFMFSAGGEIIGYPDLERLRRAEAKAGAGARAGVAALDDPVALAAYENFRDGSGKRDALRRFSVGGVDYLCQTRPMDEFGSNDDYIALVAPQDEFLGPLAKTRNTSLLFALGLVLVVAPLLGLAASGMSRGLCRLAHDANRVRRLDLERCETMRSLIAEVDELGVAVSDMRCALSSYIRYLPRTLMKQILDTGVEPVPGGLRREITLLFTDVENFTPLAENLLPEELMAAMSEYFEAVGKAILVHGGTIDKFIGDAVMAFWNAPVESKDHVEQACAAAIALSRASEELNKRRAEAGLPLLRTRVGLHTGAAVVGNVGASDRMDYTALGANVNLASRLEGLNKFYATNILVSRDVRERAKKTFLFRSVDVVIAKGVTAPVAVFQLLGSMPTSPYPALAAPRAMLGFCSRWERAITLYRTMQWPRALEEFTALAAQLPDDRLATMYVSRTTRLLENKQGRDWKAVQRYSAK